MALNLHPYRMAWSFRVGRLFGIDIKVHLLFLVVMAVFCLEPMFGENGSIRAGAIWLLVFLLLFSFVLIHELSHSLAALRMGIRVYDIVLWPLGGLARLESTPDRPKSEFIIAAAGPLASLGLAALIYPFWFFYGQEKGDPYSGNVIAEFLLSFSLHANLLIGLVNLIPAFPLDGGRVLRALAARKMSHFKATMLAVNIGKILIVAGLLFAAITGQWFFIIVLTCLFIWWAGSAELRSARARATWEAMGVEASQGRSPIIDGEKVSDSGEDGLKPYEKEFIRMINRLKNKDSDS